MLEACVKNIHEIISKKIKFDYFNKHQNIMKNVDKILEQLGDSDWHSIDEIKKEIYVPEDKLEEILRFLQEQGLISKVNQKLKITAKGLRFLELPL